MTIPPLFEQLHQKRKELNEQFKLMSVVFVPEYYTLENLPVLNDMEKTLHEMLNLIENIKQSQTRHNRGQHSPKKTT